MTVLERDNSSAILLEYDLLSRNLGIDSSIPGSCRNFHFTKTEYYCALLHLYRTEVPTVDEGNHISLYAVRLFPLHRFR